MIPESVGLISSAECDDKSGGGRIGPDLSFNIGFGGFLLDWISWLPEITPQRNPIHYPVQINSCASVLMSPEFIYGKIKSVKFRSLRVAWRCDAPCLWQRGGVTHPGPAASRLTNLAGFI